MEKNLLKENISEKSILVTGGTGSFGKAFTKKILNLYKPKRLIIFSRDEHKQNEMANELKKYSNICFPKSVTTILLLCFCLIISFVPLVILFSLN